MMCPQSLSSIAARYRDMVFERLIHQSWQDTQSKINMERKVS